MKRLDCIIIVDGALTPMAERQLEAMLDLHVGGGIATGVLTLWQARSELGWPASPAIASHVDGEIVAWLDPKGRYSASVALVLSPGLAGVALTHLPHVDAETILIWPIEPPRRGQLALPEQAPDLSTTIGEKLGGNPIWCARTASERHHLAREAVGLDLAPTVWWPFLGEPVQDQARPDAPKRHRVGRHWQDDRPLGPIAGHELAEAFGDAWPLELAFQGPLPVLRSLPPTHESQALRLIDDEQMTRQDFLKDLALFMTLGAAEDPFGVPFEIFEAMAEDALVIGPDYLSSAIDASLPGAGPTELGGLAIHLMSDDLAYEKAIDHQRQLHYERHASAPYRAQLDSYLDRPTRLVAASPRPADSRREDRVLFVSDDSPHLEHLSRQLAIAEHLPEQLKAFFVTTGRDAWLVEQRGHPVEFTTPHNSPSYAQIGHAADGWNFWFERQFAELLAFVDPRAVVFDGVYPFGGMMANRHRFPDMAFIWIRQPLWRPDARRDALRLTPQLDLVIEPGDLAAEFDRGPTARLAEHVLQTTPVVTADFLSREEARQLLGLADGDVAILLDSTLPEEVMTSDAADVLIDGLIEGGASLWSFIDQRSETADRRFPEREIRWIDDPSSRNCCSAFDGAISAANYRGLHDQAAAGLPTIFVAGLGSSSDDQAARIAYAERQGWAMVLRQRDVYGARDAGQCLLDPDRRRAMASRFEGGQVMNGAEEAASAIAEAVFSLPLGDLPGDGMADQPADAAE